MIVPALSGAAYQGFSHRRRGGNPGTEAQMPGRGAGPALIPPAPMVPISGLTVNLDPKTLRLCSEVRDLLLGRMRRRLGGYSSRESAATATALDITV